jgi:prepilin-type N-terminal cleavage/methylation domain-containing protein
MLRYADEGFTLIELILVVTIIAVIAAIATPYLHGSKKSANEASAISSLRALTTVNEQYRVRFKAYSSGLATLSSAGYIDEVLGAGDKSGYGFFYTSTSGSTWSCAANPQTVQDGDRRFFVDQSGLIRFHSSQAAQSTDAPIR